MTAETSHVEIGYLEEVEPWMLESRFFPSKVGGKPAWLDLKDINVDLQCSHCSKTCIFLCQVYAPLTERPETYHRTLYVFICKNPECSKPNDNGSFIVYRCQLGQINDFYSPDEPEEREDWFREATVDKYSRVCIVCGCFASNRCGNCKETNYCSRDHQLMDWKSGHKAKCGLSGNGSAEILFPEFEIISMSEIIGEEDAEKLKKSIEKSEEEKMKDYQDYISKFSERAVSDADLKIMEELTLVREDKYFKMFKKMLSICPDQVIRYEKGGEPLWISKRKITDVPNCEICNGPREFEFQILPTLLTSLNVDSLGQSIDWGTLLVYSCKNSCNGGPTYKREFLYKQDVDE